MRVRFLSYPPGKQRALSKQTLTHAVWDSKPEPGKPITWVELKTSADIRSDRDMVNFERKLLKFWIQSFLLGVPKIIVGFRSRDGVLLRLEEIETVTIPDTVAHRGKGQWDGNICINFASAFLECKCDRVQQDSLLNNLLQASGTSACI